MSAWSDVGPKYRRAQWPVTTAWSVMPDVSVTLAPVVVADDAGAVLSDNYIAPTVTTTPPP
jgi:hypothetical protein